MRKGVGTVLCLLAMFGALVSAIGGFVLCMKMLMQLEPSLALIIACFVFFPFVLAVAPFYAAFALGDWLPIGVVYGGGLVCVGMAGLGVLVAGESL